MERLNPPSRRRRRLVVLSMDGLSVREWDALQGLPNFSALLAAGAASTSLRTVYPSLTYVAHTTMMTGRHPAAHGITSNEPLQPGVPEERRRWHWYAREVRVPTLFDLARGAGMKCAALLWPLVSGARITWNFPEILALPGENQVLKVMGSGSPAYLLGLQLRFGARRRGKEQPALDDFVSEAAAWTIRRRRPGLAMVHLVALDAAKHAHGCAAPETRAALESLDRSLGRVRAAIRDSGAEVETALAVFGDHGHMDTVRLVRPNRALAQAGLCGREGGSFRPRAWFHCSGGSAFLHVRPGDPEAEHLALAALRAAGLDAPGILSVLDRARLDALHADPEARCAIEGEPGTRFVEEEEGPLVEDCPAPGAFGADHGYLPDLPGYRGLFLAEGPGIRPGTGLGDIEMVDLAPTLAAWLGLEFAETDGRIIEGLFED